MPAERAGSTAAMPAVQADPLAALGAAAGAAAREPEAAPGSAATAQSAVSGVEPCPHCGTPLALDQRYCLECGAPRTYLSGMLLERLRSPGAQTSPGQPTHLPASGGGAGTLVAPAPQGAYSTWQRGNVLTLIASVGVLLLAMGVGVLIGRSGGSSSSGSAAPQIVTVPAAATGAASPATTPTTPATSSAAKAGAAAAGAAAANHKAKAEESSGTGASLSKPAPPSVLKGLGKGSGASNEQKSKNLPNVVSTG